MRQFNSIESLAEFLDLQRDRGHEIGFVPTMGALHQGHLSLLERAIENNPVSVMSIFVNPTQFNDPLDLERYPRNLEADISMLERYPLDALFAPGVEEIYPDRVTKSFDFGGLDRVMEGKYRPGHFNGVAQVVSRLFSIVNPDRAYFGLKDFQQYTIIRRLVKELGLQVEIIGCPIIREKDGLAMSSRNQLLSAEERQAAPLIFQALLAAREMKRKYEPAEVKEKISNRINDHPLMNLEYFEIVDDQNLMPVTSWDEPLNKVGCIAVQLSGARLIDNIYFD